MAKRMKFYAGIGSRETPQDIQAFMAEIASFLESRKMILRSGAADGADAAFERGVKDPNMKEIYLPWKGYNKHPSELCHVYPDAMKFASKYHPSWESISPGAQRLIARDGYQVVGLDLQKPVRFVVCWTKKGKEAGGTGQAIRIARQFDIPVLNLYFKRVQNIVKECMLSDQLFA